MEHIKDSTFKLSLNQKQGMFLEAIGKRKTAPFYCASDVVRLYDNAIPSGQVFAIASFLQEQGYVTSFLEENPQYSIPRRYYSITATGELILSTYKSVQKARDSKEVFV